MLTQTTSSGTVARLKICAMILTAMHAHKHDPQPLHHENNRSGGGAGFTRFKTFRELFEPYPHLADCEAKFDSHHITPELATTMDVAQLERVLPGLPLGHVLLCKSLLEGAHVVAAVKDPYMRFQSRRIGALEINGSPTNEMVIWWEVCVVMTTLFLTISLSALFSAPQSCAFEDPGEPSTSFCEKLVWVDTILWANAAGFFGIGTTAAWFLIQHGMILGDARLPTWMGRNIGIFMSPVTTFLTGQTMFTAGIATRAMLVNASELRGRVVAGIIFFVYYFCQWSWWFVSAKRVWGYQWNAIEIMKFQLGAFGFTGKFRNRLDVDDPALSEEPQPAEAEM